jgi:hypothetical protein
MNSFALLVMVAAQAPIETPPPPTTTPTTTPLPECSQTPPPPATTTTLVPRRQRVAVYELRASGIDPRVARITTGSIVAELRKLEGITVIGLDEVQAMLDFEAQKQLAGCTDESCLADIAEALGADIIVVGDLAAVGEEHLFGLRRVDQRNARVAGQVNQRLRPENGEEFLAVVGPAVEALFPELPLKRGRSRGVAPELAVRLNPPPLEPWVFWSGVGVAGVATAVAGGASTVWLVAEQDRTDVIDAGIAKGDQLNALTARADTAFVSTVIAWSAAGVAVLATAASAGFVDWNGYRNAIALESEQ